MSSDDPVGAYVKPYDSAQEVITLHNASGLALHGNPSRDHSWFPGYGLYFSSMLFSFQFPILNWKTQQATSIVAHIACYTDSEEEVVADIHGRLRCALPVSPTLAGYSGLTRGMFFRNPSGGYAVPEFQMIHNQHRTDRPRRSVVTVGIAFSPLASLELRSRAFLVKLFIIVCSITGFLLHTILNVT
jgi:hypothetical protein